MTVLTELALPPGVEAKRVASAVLADLRSAERRGVVVDSPPRAGRPTIGVRTAVEVAARNEQRSVIAQTNEQVDDLIDRLANEAPELRIAQLSAADYSLGASGESATAVAVEGSYRTTHAMATDPAHSLRELDDE
ncbi:hypothetical protein [Micromonospora sp. RTP1Z1]|uniref:hypothetical protein n=1 Tax=Micromonospora sp. RTP1Z1 TaxID=2994043 RepID=UPI0029C8021D|nr:hypothetical protein [Micromonospora sp. RTP1Z1]